MLFLFQTFPKSSAIFFNTVPTLSEPLPTETPTKIIEMQIITAIFCCDAILLFSKSIFLNSISAVLFIRLNSISFVTFNLIASNFIRVELVDRTLFLQKKTPFCLVALIELRNIKMTNTYSRAIFVGIFRILLSGLMCP